MFQHTIYTSKVTKCTIVHCHKIAGKCSTFELHVYPPMYISGSLNTSFFTAHGTNETILQSMVPHCTYTCAVYNVYV